MLMAVKRLRLLVPPRMKQPVALLVALLVVLVLLMIHVTTRRRLCLRKRLWPKRTRRGALPEREDPTAVSQGGGEAGRARGRCQTRETLRTRTP